MISFGHVQIRLYQSGLGDHPSVSCGVPIGLTDEWRPGGTILLLPSNHNGERNHMTPKRMSTRCERLTPRIRMARCLSSGSTYADIHEVCREVRQVQEQRTESIQILNSLTEKNSRHPDQSLSAAWRLAPQDSPHPNSLPLPQQNEPYQPCKEFGIRDRGTGCLRDADKSREALPRCDDPWLALRDFRQLIS